MAGAVRAGFGRRRRGSRSRSSASARRAPCDQAADAARRRRGRRAGIERPGRGGATPTRLRLLVGPWAAVGSAIPRRPARRRPGDQRRLRPLRARGDGWRLVVLDRIGRARSRGSGAGAGLVAGARATATSPPTWVVTGDRRRRASTRRRRLLDADASRDHYAVATVGGDTVTAVRPRRADEVAARLRAAAAARSPTRAPRRRPSTSARSSLVAFVFSNPIVLAGAGAAVAVAGLRAGAGRALRAAAAVGARRSGVLVIAVNVIVSQRGDTILVRGFDVCRCSGRSTSAREALVEGAVLALRIAVVLCRLRRPLRLRRPRPGAAAAPPAGAPLGAHRDPDHAARPARRRRPGAAARGRVAARPGGGAGRPRRACPPAASPARSTAPSTSPRRSSCAATRAASRARGAPAGAARATAGASRLAGVAIARARDRRARRRRRRLRPVPDDLDRRRRARRSRSPRRCRLLAAAPVPRDPAARPGGGAVAEPLVGDAAAFALPLPGAARAGAARRRPRARARASSSSSPGARGRASRRLLRALLRARPALPRRRGVGLAARSAGSTSATHGPAELGGLVGLVGQDPETQVVSATVRGELELPLELRGEPAAARARAIEEVTLALGIAELLERPTDTLSGGELQRVALAAALVLRPRLVLLDEPTSQLDPVAGDELIGLLRRLNEEWGMAVRARRAPARALPRRRRPRARLRPTGAVAFDGSPHGFCEWVADRRPDAGAARRAAVRARRARAAAGLGRRRRGGRSRGVPRVERPLDERRGDPPARDRDARG